MMKQLVFIALLCAFTACGNSRYQAAMDYLTAWMPEGDRDTLSAEFLAHNVEYALRAREEFPWTKTLPDSIFLNEVLPYAVVDEPREEWRGKFYDIFAPKVRGAASMCAAIDSVNRNLNKTIGVEYDMRRRRTNQSPLESMAQGMASCTGLSIILVDAFRSVGIPARFAGTPAWYDDRGNHSWVEVWIDGKWHFTEFYPDSKGLDNSWIVADAGRGNPYDRMHSIWATSWRPTGETFPMVWNMKSNAVHGVNVTDRYVARLKEVSETDIAAGTHVQVCFTMWRDRDAERTGNSDGRIASDIAVFRGTERMGGGRTSGPRDDVNNTLTFALPKNAEYTFTYTDTSSKEVNLKATVGDTPIKVTGYME